MRWVGQCVASIDPKHLWCYTYILRDINVDAVDTSPLRLTIEPGDMNARINA
jgi:hypothetical protein